MIGAGWFPGTWSGLLVRQGPPDRFFIFELPLLKENYLVFNRFIALVMQLPFLIKNQFGPFAWAEKKCIHDEKL
jgi:hypothetical protein